MKNTDFKHLFFDLDHTLWDFEKSSAETLEELYDRYQIGSLSSRNIQKLDFIAAFRVVNRKLWQQYDRGKVDREKIRSERFPMIFAELGIPAVVCPADMGEVYLSICPTKPYLMAEALSTLQRLNEHYELHILTNGFKDVQHIKMRSANIYHFFKQIITSECTGHKKPNIQIFQYAMEQAKTSPEHSVMIGDNPRADIQGGKAAGMYTVFYNPDRIAHGIHPHLEINSLGELSHHF
ncbi:YjjG family noncanonical pyrimidine nucleotidase [Algivirga pacifica]|uniref:YjjG family noncanonical pyrimidine nucleotidase n=1 Tax=Algivirga pacifica TaxID=1162670 RepID=A0ABP9DLV4_9BACT